MRSDGAFPFLGIPNKTASIPNSNDCYTMLAAIETNSQFFPMGLIIYGMLVSYFILSLYQVLRRILKNFSEKKKGDTGSGKNEEKGGPIRLHGHIEEDGRNKRFDKGCDD